MGPNKLPDVVLVGHPFAPIGRGEDIRSSYQALRSVGIEPKVLDIYGLQLPEDNKLHQLINRNVTKSLGVINIFHINGDEVDQTLNHLNIPKLASGYNIIYPAWELEKYPISWASELDRFNEVWAPSEFIYSSLKSVINKPLYKLNLSSEVVLDRFYERDFFGIENNRYAFLISFDFRSFISRKNPFAVIESFKTLLRRINKSSVILVIKAHGADLSDQTFIRFNNEINKLGDSVKWINRTLSDVEMRNLIRVCDCYVSLHRSEGFGRGLAEAMCLAKPVIASRYSGNLDFMTDHNSLLVDIKLVELLNGDYPGWEGQKWASPEIKKASDFMINLVNNPEDGINLGRKARVSVRQKIGHRSVGVSYLNHIESTLAKIF